MSTVGRGVYGTDIVVADISCTDNQPTTHTKAEKLKFLVIKYVRTKFGGCSCSAVFASGR